MSKQVLDIQDEVWKDIEGYENLYQVSNLGRVLSGVLQSIIQIMGNQGKDVQ